MRRRDGVFECYATTTCVTRRVTRGTWPRHGATRAIALRMPHTVHLLCLCVRKPVTAARSHRIAARLDVPQRARKDLSRDASPHAQAQTRADLRARPRGRRGLRTPTQVRRQVRAARAARHAGGRYLRYSERMRGKLRWEWDRCAEGAVSASTEALALVI